jgi:ABC-type uncharacterized transport system auxiliary subunit
MSISNDKILLLQNGTEGASVENAQWSDNLPVLFQAKVIESFENSHYFEGVGRPTDGYEADQQLLVDLRTFAVAAAPAPAATVAFSARFLSGGRMLATRVFEATVPLTDVDGPAAAAGLNKAFGTTVQELVEWAAASTAPTASIEPDKGDSTP